MTVKLSAIKEGISLANALDDMGTLLNCQHKQLVLCNFYNNNSRSELKEKIPKMTKM